MTEIDAAFHDSFKPRWGPQDSLVCGKTDMQETISEVSQTWQEKFNVFSEGGDVAVMTYNKTSEVRLHFFSLLFPFGLDTDRKIVEGNA
jgi:nuclear pore complex protein Nup98-Nup96